MTMAKRRSTKKTTSSDDSSVVQTPGSIDVLFGRGGHVNHNPANQSYLELVNRRKEEYHNVQKTEKAGIAWEIMAALRERNPGMRFLRKDYSTNMWHVVGDAEVRRKISQCLRERGTPVCPTAKGPKKVQIKKQKTTATPSATKLRLSLKTPSTGRRVYREEASDEDEWLPEEEEATHTPRLTRSSMSRRSSSETASSFEEDLRTRRLEEAQRSQEAQRPQEKSSCLAQEELGMPPLQVPLSTCQPTLTTYMAEEMAKEAPLAAPSNSQALVPPPMPGRMPLKQEGSQRVWSDFFASFAPGIFELQNPESSWNMDPAVIPELATSEDEESFPGTSMPMPVPSKRSFSQASRSYSQTSIGNPLGWVECFSPLKRRKVSNEEPESETDPLSFFEGDTLSQDKVLLEQNMSTTAC